MDYQIAKIKQNLTTADQMRNQTKLVMQPYANWEEYLSPAPLSIAIMGELVFISSKTDFSINKNPPKDGYKYIRYPESFRACLMQVCNTGWQAFNDAHKNMDQIRLHTLSVPDYMKTAVKILFQENSEVVEAHLPDQLENIRTIADDCLTLANATEKRFTDVINIIQELLEACVNAEHFYGSELEEIKNRLEEKKIKKASAEEAAKCSTKGLKHMEEQMKEAEKIYIQTMNSLPSGWEMVAMDLIAAVSDSINSIVHGVTALLTNQGNRICDSTTTISDTKHNASGENVAVDDVDKINIYCKSAEILTYAEFIQQLVYEDKIDWNKLYDQKNKATLTDFQAEQLKRIKSNLEQIELCNLNNYAQSICDQGIDICNELAKYAPAGPCEDTITKEMIKNIRDFTESARKFDSKSKDVTKSPAISPEPPMMKKVEGKLKTKSVFKTAGKSTRFCIEQSRAQLNKTREVYEKNVENMEKNQKELTDILIAMRNCEVNEIDFKTTIEMLIKGMDAMGRVKEQWEKMVHFFQMMSNIVKTRLTRTLKDFASTSEKTQALSYNAKLFSKDLLYNQAFQATNIASLVHMISATYTDVSDKYLMDRVSSLGKLLTMDKDNPAFETERQQLRDKCDEAQREIFKLVLKNKDDFENKCMSRLEKIDKELLAILPAATSEEIKSIQAAVEAGFTEDGEAEYA